MALHDFMIFSMALERLRCPLVRADWMYQILVNYANVFPCFDHLLQILEQENSQRTVS